MAIILPEYKVQGFLVPFTNVYVTLSIQQAINFKTGNTTLTWWVYESKTVYDALKANTETISNPDYNDQLPEHAETNPLTIEVPRPLIGDKNERIGKISMRVTPADFAQICANTSALTKENVGNAYVSAIYEWCMTKPPFDVEGVVPITE